MKKVLAIILTIIVLCGCIALATCDTEAERVNYNITTEAENYNIYRRVTVINCIKGDTLFSIEGWMNITADTSDNQLEITVEIANGKYQKHFIGLSDNVTYTVEDITGSEVSKYHYEIKYNPNMWIPFTIKSSD
ncbi:MAG: hypothetical protein UIH27_11025 [Ruminococcus sp.]|nr:hypothetical protein [Ruminococcus sp.]